MLTAAKPHALLGCLLVAGCSEPPQPTPPSTKTRTEERQAVAKPSSASAGAEEVSYRATGTEPFWGLSVTQRELRVAFPEPEPSVATTYTVEERADGRTFKGAAVTAIVTNKACSDRMSDRSYPHTVKVEIGERVLQGCGWPAGYDLGPRP